MKHQSRALNSIPGVGEKIAEKLRLIGVQQVSDLRRADPERLYKRLERSTGAHVDRCVLYVFRCAVYYATHERRDPEKLKWWNWKDRTKADSDPGNKR